MNFSNEKTSAYSKAVCFLVPRVSSPFYSCIDVYRPNTRPETGPRTGIG